LIAVKTLLPSADDKAATNVSLGGLSLLALVVFVVSLVSIDFTRNASFIATFWPSNAIALAMRYG
jgi:hypothetical protein